MSNMTTNGQIVRKGEVDSKRWFTRYPMPFAVLKSGELSPDCAVPVAVIRLDDKAALVEWLKRTVLRTYSSDSQIEVAAEDLYSALLQPSEKQHE